MAKISCKQSKFECCQYLSLLMGFCNFGFCLGRYFVLSLSSPWKTSATYTLRYYVSESKAASSYEFLKKRCYSVADRAAKSRCFKSSYWELFCKKGVLRSIFVWKFEALRIAQEKLDVLLKMCLFGWNIELFWILIERTNSEHSCKIRHSGKDLPIFMSGICLLGVLFYP